MFVLCAEFPNGRNGCEHGVDQRPAHSHKERCGQNTCRPHSGFQRTIPSHQLPQKHQLTFKFAFRALLPPCRPSLWVLRSVRWLSPRIHHSRFSSSAALPSAVWGDNHSPRAKRIRGSRWGGGRGSDSRGSLGDSGTGFSEYEILGCVVVMIFVLGAGHDSLVN